MVDVARGAVGEVTALLQDARLTAPESGEIAAVYPERGELVGAGTPIMSLVVLEDAHAVLNVREDLMPRFRMGGTFRADVPALDRRGVVFRVYYISPLGSYATWRSTKQAGSYDLRTLRAEGEARAGGRGPSAGHVGAGQPERAAVAYGKEAENGLYGRAEARAPADGFPPALFRRVRRVAVVLHSVHGDDLRLGPDGAHSGRRGRSGLDGLVAQRHAHRRGPCLLSA